MMIDPRTPVLVGAAQHTQRASDRPVLSPMGMVSRAAKSVLEECEIAGLSDQVELIAMLRFTVDSTDFLTLPYGRYPNPPASLARALGARPAEQYYVETGGNTPQKTVNYLGGRIASGEIDIGLIAGGEALSSLKRLMISGKPPNADNGWTDEQPGDPVMLGDDRPGVDELEAAHGLFPPINTYPLIESTIRAERGTSLSNHMEDMGRLFASFSQIAARNPRAWFPQERTAQEIATPTAKNRLVGAPYTKFMNANIEVDMSAALVMMSVGKAEELGVPREKWVFLHGAAEVNEIWNVSRRPALDRSPAIKAMTEAVLDMAGKRIADIDFLDLYSCFPSAVEIACREMGIAQNDPRGLTITGGLPFFGGPGNCYSLHAIAEMMARVRARPGTYGLVTANGWYLTKHAAGIYSTVPIEGSWQMPNQAALQRQADGTGPLEREDQPEGRGVIEAYTITHNQKGPETGIVIGRLGNGKRFLANLPGKPALLRTLLEGEQVGRPGQVSTRAKRAIFTPEGEK